MAYTDIIHPRGKSILDPNDLDFHCVNFVLIRKFDQNTDMTPKLFEQELLNTLADLRKCDDETITPAKLKDQLGLEVKLVRTNLQFNNKPEVKVSWSPSLNHDAEEFKQEMILAGGSVGGLYTSKPYENHTAPGRGHITPYK